ncbi:unnamed protein product [Caenorhabditis angaria]|uniref:Uncharacterized protein n=1 Tax=Caenorhabditis angaria TaxID=860376 RepID=A0A9P1I6P0_9PELO|nr:unnamed protein product [Caenorhabditis angaria]
MKFFILCALLVAVSVVLAEPIFRPEFGKSPACPRLRGKSPPVVSVGKAPNSMMRMGKSPSVMRFGKAPNSMMRMGKSPSVMRFGKSPIE